MANQVDNTVVVAADQAPDEAPFSCNLCPKTFTSWQALGGHQNAHRKERYAIKKMENERKMAQARQARMERARLLVHRPPTNPGFAWPGPNGPPPTQFQNHSASYGPPAFRAGGPGWDPEVVAGPSSPGAQRAEAESTVDLTLKL